MRGIIITGSPRSGKTTFIERLLKEQKGYIVVNGDAIAVSLFYVKNGKPNYAYGRKKVYEIFEKTILEDPKLSVILDFHYLEEEKLLEYYKKGYEIIFFGYPNISINQLMNRIRSREKKTDWTTQSTEKELYKILKKGIVVSKRDYLFCKETGLKYIDTSFNQEEKYKELIDYFKKREVE